MNAFRLIKLANHLDDGGHPEISDDLDDLLFSRTIPFQEVPGDPNDPFWTGRRRFYHTTNALKDIREQGLRSREEQRKMGREVRQGLGGGWDERVSLTPHEHIAETISNRMRDIVEIVNSQSPEIGFKRAKELGENIAKSAGLDPDDVLDKAWELERSRWMNMRDDDPWRDRLSLAKLSGYELVTPYPHERPFIEDVPPGAVIKRTTKSDPDYRPDGYDGDEERVLEYWLPISDEEDLDKWGYEVIHFYDLILRVIEDEGGPSRPGFWGTSGRHVRGLSPEDIGIVQVIAEGDPERIHEDVLDEYEFDPRRTKVII